MVTKLFDKTTDIKQFPKISDEISDVFERYYKATDENLEYAKSFLDAWLKMQKEEGIAIYMANRYKPT